MYNILCLLDVCVSIRTTTVITCSFSRGNEGDAEISFSFLFFLYKVKSNFVLLPPYEVCCFLILNIPVFNSLTSNECMFQVYCGSSVYLKCVEMFLFVSVCCNNFIRVFLIMKDLLKHERCVSSVTDPSRVRY